MDVFALGAPGLVLDEVVADDAERVFEYCQDPLFERVLSTPWPYTRMHANFFVGDFVPKGWRADRELTWALRTATGQPLLGVIGLRLRGAGIGDLGFWLGAPHRGHGYMPAAVTAVLDWAFESLETVRWECVEGNRASMTVARKTGFTFTGTELADVPARDGSRPLAWHGSIAAGDSRDEKPGWPA